MSRTARLLLVAGLLLALGCGEGGDAGPLFWQLVPQSRGADDGFACILGRDPKTVEVFVKYAEPRALR